MTESAQAAAPDLSSLRVAVIGTGNMGGALLQAFLASKLLRPDQVCGTERQADHAKVLSARFGVRVTTDNLAAAREADVILLAVKPAQIADLLHSIAPALTPKKLLISVAAAVSTRAIENAAGCEVPVVRAMPNTPAMLSAGMTVFCGGRYTDAAHMAVAERFFAAVGRTAVLDEKLMDAATGLSGSGPAFVYVILDALADAGVNVGLPRDVATLLAAQTLYGSARMVLETGRHPAQLRDEVTTPNGTTVAGILALEEGNLRATLIHAVKASAARAKELAG